MKDGFYGMRTDFTLPDVYRSLDYFADFEVELQRHLNERVKETMGRDLSYAFYDVTNYFFEIDFLVARMTCGKEACQRSTEPTPLLRWVFSWIRTDYPVSMSMFPGNTSDSLTLQPTIEQIKGFGRDWED